MWKGENVEKRDKLYNSKLWIEDIDTVLSILPELRDLSNKSILITGASGLVCSTIVDILFRYNDTYNASIHICAAGRSEEKMKMRFGDLIFRPDFAFVPYDAAKLDNKLDLKYDFIIHGASNSSPDTIVKEPVETMLSNFLGIKFLMDYARVNNTKRVLYISTSEVYGKKDSTEPYQEGQYGYIDLLNPRSSYSISKSAAETFCISYSYEFGVESVIVRPGHIYGPTASPNDNHVSSVWAYQAARREDIVMKSDGAQIRSYCYCIDCASAILKVLLTGKACHAYNISNPDSILNIKEMGQILARAGGVGLKIEIPSGDEKKRFNPMNNSSLSSDNLLALGWRGCFDAYVGIGHTVEILRELL